MICVSTVFKSRAEITGQEPYIDPVSFLVHWEGDGFPEKIRFGLRGFLQKQPDRKTKSRKKTSGPVAKNAGNYEFV